MNNYFEITKTWYSLFGGNEYRRKDNAPDSSAFVLSQPAISKVKLRELQNAKLQKGNRLMHKSTQSY